MNEVLDIAKDGMGKKKYTFIDLFAGIGGFHYAMESIGAKCVFASEWDKNARITYEENFKEISPNLFVKDGDGNMPHFNCDINERTLTRSLILMYCVRVSHVKPSPLRDLERDLKTQEALYSSILLTLCITK